MSYTDDYKLFCVWQFLPAAALPPYVLQQQPVAAVPYAPPNIGPQMAYPFAPSNGVFVYVHSQRLYV